MSAGIPVHRTIRNPDIIQYFRTSSISLRKLGACSNNLPKWLNVSPSENVNPTTPPQAADALNSLLSQNAVIAVLVFLVSLLSVPANMQQFQSAKRLCAGPMVACDAETVSSREEAKIVKKVIKSQQKAGGCK
ncbi:uncharacterized protein EDB93DRAFT_1099837 [Suillus bovinus]|uniref:uncharacterized protein n=1 Tax=Suillus bovinus TaxID=48563 RepID=UPI001B86D1C1|nr:uncharacterized protein EDB93DRAFT_1099837 [Suillus bovinus]KAG2159481.1 hypothetical protein EDB93DRAFT_1099837 [Suillus bovinus]